MKLNFVGSNLHKNSDSSSSNYNRYGLGAGSFQLSVQFTPEVEPSEDYLLGRASASLSVMPDQTEEICNVFLKKPCVYASTGCPLTKDIKVKFAAVMPFAGKSPANHVVPRSL